MNEKSLGELVAVYVGDAGDVVDRILTNHTSGNVEGSALRKAVSEALGYRLARKKRPSGSIKVRIDLPNPREGENKVSAYIRSGMWRYVICPSYDEAHDFQWFVIDKLKPVLNRLHKTWNPRNLKRYRFLLAQLENAPLLLHDQLRGEPTGPGVYVLHHRDPKLLSAR